MLTHKDTTSIRCGGLRRQAGMTLMESMIALGLSVFVTSAMVVLMANSLGTASRVIQMTQLTDELRNSMSMLTRDIRRANYTANSMYCYANSDCGTDGSATQAGDITIDPDTQDCVVFNLDRNHDGDASLADAGGFRLRVIQDRGDVVGLIEMWVGGSGPACESRPQRTPDVDWIAITDPDFVDVTAFVIDDSGSILGSVGESGGTTVTQRTRQIQIQITGQLRSDRNITRTVEDIIKVRNDLITSA